MRSKSCVVYVCACRCVCARSVYMFLRPPTCLHSMCMHVCRREKGTEIWAGVSWARGPASFGLPQSQHQGVSPAFTTKHRAGSGQAGTGPGSGPQRANDQLAPGILAAAPWPALGLQAPRLWRKWGRKQGAVAVLSSQPAVGGLCLSRPAGDSG